MLCISICLCHSSWLLSFYSFKCLKVSLHNTAEDEEAFDVLYCVAFEMMDAQWLAMNASYMNFNVFFLSLHFLHLCHFPTLAFNSCSHKEKEKEQKKHIRLEF